MRGSRIDRLTRFSSGKRPRRGFLATLAALFGIRLSDASAQLATAACGAAGNACTMLLGCCAGLTCVTSALNPSYGVCATGDGGLITVGGTSLLIPGSEAAAAQAAAMATAFASATPVDLQAERQTELQERRTRHDEKISRERTNKDERRSKQRSRRSDRRERRRERAESESEDTGAEAQQVVAVSVSCPQDGTPQLVTIQNLKTATIDVSKVSSLLNPLEEEPFTPTELKLDPGTARQLQFGGADGDIAGAIWLINVPIFDASPYEGVRVELRTRETYFACCDGTGFCYGVNPTVTAVGVDETKRRHGHRRKRRRQQRSGQD